MKIFLLLLFVLPFGANGQDGSTTGSWLLSATAGAMNYEGDLKPNSFTFKKSNPFFGLIAKYPLYRHINLRAGVVTGKLEADDKDNRDYLQVRNLNFFTHLHEVHLGFELVLPFGRNDWFEPYAFFGANVFNFRSYTFSATGERIYLQPLSTEGQGLTQYPDRKPYKNTQLSVGYAGGFRVKIVQGLRLGMELHQRKTFTDYLDDVSKTYVDYNNLLAARGLQAVNIAYRGDELSGGGAYPGSGEQRGTPTEMDWYYTLGLQLEISFHDFRLSGAGSNRRRNEWYRVRCPKVR